MKRKSRSITDTPKKNSWKTIAWAVSFLFCQSFGQEEVRLEMARTLAKEGKHQEAVREYRNYLAHNPKSVQVYRELGEIRMLQGQHLLAAQNFKLALKQDPNNLQDRENLAKSYAAGGDLERSMLEWRKVESMSGSATQKREAEEKIKELLRKMREEAPTPSAAPGEVPAAQAKPAAKKTPQPELKAKKPARSANMSSPKFGEKVYQDPDFVKVTKLYQQKEYQKALEAIHQVLKKTPGHPGAYYWAGVIRYNKDQLKKAEYNFKRSFAYPEKGFNANFYLGRIYQRFGEKGKALQAYRAYLKQTQSESGKRQAQQQIDRLMATNNPEKVAVSGTNTDPSATAGAGRKKSASPVKTSQKSISTSPEVQKVPPISTLALQDPYRLFIPETDGVGAKQIQQAYEFVQARRFDKAIQSLQKVVLQFGGSLNANAVPLNLATIYTQMGIPKSAEANLSRFLQETPPRLSALRPQAHFLRALNQSRTGKVEQAQKNLRKIKPVRKYGPSREDLLKAMAESYEADDQPRQAIAFLQKQVEAATAPAKQVPLLMRLAYAQQKAGEHADAEKTARQMKQHCGEERFVQECQDAHIFVGDLAFKAKKWKTSLQEYQGLLQAFPNAPEAAWAHYQIANIHKRKNEYSRALDQYKLVMDTFPESYWAQQAKWKREDTIWEKEYEEVLD